MFPRIVRTGYNAAGHRLTYYLNYSDTEQSIVYAGRAAKELTTGRRVEDGNAFTLRPWGVRIVEEDA